MLMYSDRFVCNGVSVQNHCNYFIIVLIRSILLDPVGLPLQPPPRFISEHAHADQTESLND